MTNQQAIDFVRVVFDKIKLSKTVSELENITTNLKFHTKNMMSSNTYPKIEFNISINEIRSLIESNIINDDLNFESDISTKLTDPLSKLLYATAWKNGDLLKIRHIIKGILDSKTINENQNDALVFYQFGKYLTKTPGQPIIDQHVIRAFSIYKMIDRSKIENLRKIKTVNKTHKDTINDYKNWLISDELTKELKAENDYTYHIDKLLFAVGKTIKFKKLNQKKS